MKTPAKLWRNRGERCSQKPVTTKHLLVFICDRSDRSSYRSTICVDLQDHWTSTARRAAHRRQTWGAQDSGLSSNTIYLTLLPPIPLRRYTLPYWSNPPFLPERDYVTFGFLLSQFRLSVCLSVVCRLSVTLVHPTQGVEPFGKISSPLCALAILWPPCKILRR